MQASVRAERNVEAAEATNGDRAQRHSQQPVQGPLRALLPRRLSNRAETAMAATFLIRVRGKDGMWRVPGVSEATTIAEVKTLVQDLKGVEADTQTLSLDAKGDALADGDVLGDLGIGRGDILFIRYDGTAAKAAAPAPAASMEDDLASRLAALRK